MKRIVSTGLAAAGLAASAVAARRGVPDWDRSSFVAINDLPDGLQYPLWPPMQLGALAAPLVIGGVVAVRGDVRRGIGVAAAGAATWGAAKVLKNAVGRGRPVAFVESTTIRLGSADTGLGYPSGHAGVAMAVALTFPDTPDTAKRLLSLAPIVVGFSRIHVGAHFPLDVVGGWFLGACVAAGTNWAVERLGA